MSSLENFKLKGKKLYCRVWSDTGENGTPQILACKKIKFGSPEFSVKVGGRNRLYKINYRNKGIIKQDGKKLIYDVLFQNTLGGLSFYEFPEDMDSEETYTAFKNNAVKMYVAKGGIPAWYLLISLGVAMIGFIVMGITVPPALEAQEQVKFLDAQIVSLKQQLAISQSQAQSGVITSGQ